MGTVPQRISIALYKYESSWKMLEVLQLLWFTDVSRRPLLTTCQDNLRFDKALLRIDAVIGKEDPEITNVKSEAHFFQLLKQIGDPGGAGIHH